MKNWIVLLACLLAWVVPVSLSHADEVYTFVIKKQEEKAKSRWSLSEWLETRDRMRLMDMWLALHSPSPYEFYFGGEYSSTDTSPRHTFWQGHFAAYASIFGLELQRGFAPQEEWLGIFHLRVFGFHAQGTNITPEIGMRSESEPYSLRNAFAGVSTTLCINRFFGIDGLYRHHFRSAPSSSGLALTGDQYQLGAFIDFKFWRVYGNYQWIRDTVSGSISQNVKQNGFTLGTRLYF